MPPHFTRLQHAANVNEESTQSASTAFDSGHVEGRNRVGNFLSTPSSRDPATRPGPPRTPSPDSDTENTTTAVISADTRNPSRTAQHDI